MKTRLVFFACLAALLLQACQEDPYLTVSPDSLTFSQDGGSQTVRISANYPWTASVSGTGFSVSPASGEGAGSVTVTAAATSSTDPVTGSLTIRSEGLSASVSLTQDAKFAILVGSGATIPAEGGSYSVDIQYNTDFTVEVEASAKSWITFNGTKALQSGKLEFLFAANETTDPRTGTVTVKDKTGKVSPVTITFTQEEKKVIKVGDTAIIPAEGGTFEVDVQYNTDFTVEVEGAAQDWITFVKTKALQSGKLEFLFAANETTDPRTGTVTVKDKTGKVSPVTITFIQEEKKVINVGETTTIPAEGGSFEVDVQYNTDFTVEVEEAAQDWITFVKTKALQSGKLEFLFAANETTDPRTGTVTVKDKTGKVSPVTITFIQEEKKVINVGETTTIPAEGGTFEVDVQYNTDFTVEVEEAAQDWITFVKTKALQNGKLEFFFAANETPEPRTGTVTVKDKTGKVSPITITFIQEEKKVISVGETTTIPAEGGSFEVDVQYNTDFTVEVEEAAQDWITFVKTKALQNGKLEFLFAANETTDPRTGIVTVKDTKGKVAPITITFIQEEKKVINVGETTTIPAEGGTFEVDVQYNTDFTVEVEEAAQDWITFVKTKALQNGKLEFFFAANETTEPRTGTVTVKDTKGKVSPITITFIQEEKKVINVGETTSIPAEGGTFEVDVQYNTDFTVEIEETAQDWITFVKTKALQNGKLEFLFAANETTDPRTGTVTVKDTKGKVSPITITFIQEEKKVINVGETTTIPAEGGTFEVDVQYNTDFTVEIEETAQDWITFVKTKALQNDKLEFFFAANETTEPRTGTVTVKDTKGKVAPITITFIQEEKKVINVGDVATIPEEGGLIDVDIQYNTDFSVSVEDAAQSWITFVQTKALQNGKLEFEIAANEFDDIREGQVFIQSKDGTQILQTITFKQESKMRRLLMAFYQAMDGPNWTWTIQDNWGTDMPFWRWRGVEGSKDKGVTVLNLQRVGLKGSIPDIIGEFTNLNSFHVDAPGITGTLPETFRQLINLTNLYIVNTSMTSLPDVFSDMKKLEFAQIIQNEQMTGPLPESIGLSPVLERLNISNNAFTGGLPESWAHLGEKLYLGNNCLSGTIPQAYLDSEYFEYYMSEFLWQKTGYGFDISGIEIPRSNCLGTAEDLDGNTLSFNEIIGKNRYTVYLVWTPWDPYSRTLLLQMKDYYEEFHEAGLEVIATGMTDRSGNIWTDKNEQKQYILDNGLDSWCNIYYPSTSDYPAIPMSLPNAEVYDSNGNIVFSGFNDYPDPVRDRFGKIASTDLLPFLETLFGPLSYTSTDYSHDGEVVTMQTATVGNGINIVFMGDAYTDKDIESGVYENVMRRSMEEFFAIEPYKTFRNRFNVYMVKVVSPNGKVGEGYTTALGTKLLGGTTIVGNADKSETYSLLVPSITSTENLLTCVMVNEYKYAGTALMSRTAQSGVAFTATESKDPVIYGSTLRHEAGGHGFAFLADEYPSFEQTIPDYKVEEYKDLYNQFGWYQNVDFTNDPSKVHWSVFLADDRYKSEVGIYEGAFYYRYGVWRPSENSKMKDNLEYFNAPSRWAIYKRIMELSGEEYSFEKFLEYDAVNRGAAAAAAAAVRPPMKAAAKRHTGPTAPPVIRP